MTTSATVPGRKEIQTELALSLGTHLANLHSLAVRLQNFYWNAEGLQFFALQPLLERQSKQFAREVNIVGKRIRAMGEYVPARMQELHDNSLIADRQQPRDIDGILEDLVTCYVIVRQFCVETLEAADLARDSISAQMLIRHLEQLEQAIWLFRSGLQRAGKPVGRDRTRIVEVPLERDATARHAVRL